MAAISATSTRWVFASWSRDERRIERRPARPASVDATRPRGASGAGGACAALDRADGPPTMSAFSDIDRTHMAHALRLAEQGLYTTHPNPRVGCVIARGARTLGAGWHRRAGEPHAEVHALREAGERARGATAYVTLEPCAHFGRTP
ncbi:bifunctional diaminohydroxyphosphoribosylaminopyrimidine deaminase/5-amino-6-(5-phosphoribosylamino)uracil reductase RibD, partial [Burkholderia pseudomallei]